MKLWIVIRDSEPFLNYENYEAIEFYNKNWVLEFNTKIDFFVCKSNLLLQLQVQIM